MIIRNYNEADCGEIVELFFDCVHNICCKDYNIDQLNAWVATVPDKAKWNAELSHNFTIVAQRDEMIVGFGDIDGDYLDRLYVHKDWQGLGVGSKIVAALQAHALQQHIVKITTHASITALPFFEKLGYVTINPQSVVRGGVTLTNYVMTKNIETPTL